MPEVRVLASRECPWFTAQVRDDGILTYRPIPGLVLTRDIATQVLRIGLQIVARPPVPTLVLMQEIARVDREARAFFASAEYLSLTSQSALVVGSPVSRVIGNFFVGLNRLKYPCELFHDPELAIAWLRSFLS